jgi:Fungal Zn(2)-Cys(6) binuclear cluster domain
MPGRLPLGCHNCSKRRIKCDQTKPECEKCLRKGLVCPRYGKRYRFTSDIASRGRQAGKSTPLGDNLGASTSQPFQLPSTLTWPSECRTGVDGVSSTTEGTSQAAFQLPPSHPSLSVASNDTGLWPSPSSPTMSLISKHYSIDNPMFPIGCYSLSRPIEVLDVRGREFLAYCKLTHGTLPNPN